MRVFLSLAVKLVTYSALRRLNPSGAPPALPSTLELQFAVMDDSKSTAKSSIRTRRMACEFLDPVGHSGEAVVDKAAE